MTHCTSSIRSAIRTSPLFQFRIWHLAALVFYVAIAIVDIKDARPREPALIGLAVAGFAAYTLLCWLGWHGMRRFEHRIGLTVVVIIYSVAMAAIFLAATIMYLTLEYAYLSGSVSRLLRAMRLVFG